MSARSLLYFHHAGGLPAVPRGIRAAAGAAGCDRVEGIGFEQAAEGLTWATIEMLAALSIGIGGDRLADAVLYGHSMGGLVAFEACRQLKAIGAALPAALVLGGTAPPGTLPSTAEACARLGISAQKPSRSETRVRIGIERARAYTPRPEPLDIDVHVLCGTDDEIVSLATMTRWADLGCESLNVRGIEGGHLFHQSTHAELSHLFVSIVNAADNS